MQAYTVHSAREATSADAVDFVPDGYAVGAFAFGLFWLVYQRMWMVLALALMVMAALSGIAYALHLHPVSVWGLSVMFNLFLGFEGHQLRRWTLERNGRPAVALVTARNLAEAEVRYFSTLATAGPRPATRAAGAALPARGDTVLGLFPGSGGRP